MSLSFFRVTNLTHSQILPLPELENYFDLFVGEPQWF